MKKFFLMIAALIFLIVGGCSDDSSSELSVDSDTIIASCEGGVYTIPVTCQSPSKATVSYNDSSTGWIFLLPSVLKGNGILELRLQPYDYVLTNRSATIEITAENVTKSVTIIQTAKPGISLNKKAFVALDTENEYSVTVASSGIWNATVNAEAASWCTLKQGTGEQGESRLIFKVNDLENNDRRIATVTVTTGSLSTDFIVYQGYGTLINNLMWAKCDVGQPGHFTSTPDKRGLLYQYNSKIGYQSIENGSTPAGYVTGAYAGGDTWQPENNPCPAGWRIPTSNEAEILIGDNSNKKFAWGWWEDEQGAYVGTNDAALANKDNTRGCIFWPMSGRRIWQDGTEDIWATTFIQTITRPGHNWGRICFQVHWNGNMYTFSDENNAAYPIRCVADIP